MYNVARHIWDQRSQRGVGAVALHRHIVVVDRLDKGITWEAMVVDS